MKTHIIEKTDLRTEVRVGIIMHGRLPSWFITKRICLSKSILSLERSSRSRTWLNKSIGVDTCSSLDEERTPGKHGFRFELICL